MRLPRSVWLHTRAYIGTVLADRTVDYDTARTQHWDNVKFLCDLAGIPFVPRGETGNPMPKSGNVLEPLVLESALKEFYPNFSVRIQREPEP
jgi:hypothetical protein